MLYDTRLDKSPAGQILKLLQQQGALSIKDIEVALGVTTNAVRQQITALLAEGFVTATTVREKRGRPHAIYSLTDNGQALFARGYADLVSAVGGGARHGTARERPPTLTTCQCPLG